MKLLESLYNKVFVNVIVRGDALRVTIELSSKKRVLYTYEEEFERLNEKMIEFVTTNISESPYFYISFLDTATQQGAIPTCTKNRLSYYHELSECEYRCYDNKWVYYTSKAELYAMEKKYKDIGIDFIFSPFTLLSSFFKDKIDGKVALYILMQDEFISMSIFENSELLYAQHLEMGVPQSSEELDDSEPTQELELDLDEGVDLEDVSVIDDIDSLDDFGDIEDLDAIEDIDEFSEMDDAEEEFNQEQEEEMEQNSESDFNQDYQRFLMIKKSIKTFYKDSKYKNEFLENVYIADSIGISVDFKRYFEEDMFMNIYIRQISLNAELSELAKEEVYR